MRPHLRALARQVRPSHNVPETSKIDHILTDTALVEVMAEAARVNAMGAPQSSSPLRPRARSPTLGATLREDGETGISEVILAYELSGLISLLAGLGPIVDGRRKGTGALKARTRP